MSGENLSLTTTEGNGWYYYSPENTPDNKISSSITDGVLAINDTSSTLTNVTVYKFEAITSGKLKFETIINLKTSNTKWSIIQLLDGNNNIAIRSDENKLLSLSLDGGITSTKINSSAYSKNTDIRIIIEIDIDNGIINITIGSDTITKTGYQCENGLTGVQFMTALKDDSRSFIVKKLTIGKAN